MNFDHGLRLFMPLDLKGRRPSMPMVPPDVPRSIAAAGRLENAVILLGEALALKTEEARDLIDTIQQRPSEIPKNYQEYEVALMLEICAKVLGALTESQKTLARSNHVGLDPLRGEYYLRRSRYYFSELRRDLENLCKILRFAKVHHLWLAYC